VCRELMASGGGAGVPIENLTAILKTAIDMPFN
jgi:hypothetical protein